MKLKFPLKLNPCTNLCLRRGLISWVLLSLFVSSADLLPRGNESIFSEYDNLITR